MRESLSRERITVLMAMEISELGRQLNPEGRGVCPLCRLGGRMSVHENGVRFACGCCRYLPPLHNGDRSWAACKLCNTQHNVIPMHAGGRKAKSDTEEIQELRRLAKNRRAVAR